MFVISMKKTKEKDPSKPWAYLMEDFDTTIYFATANIEQTKRFNTVRDAQKYFNHNKNRIIESVNLSKYDLSTLAIRRIKYVPEATLSFTKEELDRNKSEKIEIGSMVAHKDDLFLEGIVIEITGDTALVEFTYGPNSGGTLGFKLSELRKFSTI